MIGTLILWFHTCESFRNLCNVKHELMIGRRVLIRVKKLLEILLQLCHYITIINMRSWKKYANVDAFPLERLHFQRLYCLQLFY